MAVAVWLTWGVWSPGLIANADAPRNLLRARVMEELFLPHGHVDGWSPYWCLGVQQFLFHSYGYFLVIALAHLPVAPLASLGTVFKLASVAPIVALPPATYYLARRCGASREGALAAGALSLCLGSVTGFGIRGAFSVGLLLQSVGVVGFALVWPQFLDAFDGDRRRACIAAVGCGALLVTHFISGAYLLCVAGGYALVLSLSRRSVAPLAAYLMVSAAALLVAGHALFPSLHWSERMGPLVGWGGANERLGSLVAGTFFGPPAIAWLGYCGGVLAIVAGPRRLAGLAWLMVATAAVGVAPVMDVALPVVGNLTRMVFQPRSIPYVCLALAVLAGHALDAALRPLWAWRARSTGESATGVMGWRVRSSKLAALVFAAIVAFSYGGELGSLRGHVRTQSDLRFQRRVYYLRTMRWLSDNARLPAVVAFEPAVFRMAEMGAHKLTSLVNLETGLYSLSGDQAELTRANHDRLLEPARILAQQPAVFVGELRRLAVSYLLLRADSLKRHLAHATGLHGVFQAGPVTIYALRRPMPWLSGRGLRVRRSDFAAEHPRWLVRNPTPRPLRATFAVNSHPNWRASIDGSAWPWLQTPRGLIALAVPPGSHEIALDFVRSPLERAYNWLSLASLVFLAGLWVRLRP